MYLYKATFLFCNIFILSLFFTSSETLAYENDRTCTADINQFGFPSNCSCTNYQRYEFNSGKCIKLTLSEQLSAIQFLLTNAESEISILQRVSGEEAKKAAIKKLPQYFSSIAHYMRNLADDYKVSSELLRKAQRAANLAIYDIEFCSSDMMSECTYLLDQLNLTILEINKMVNTKGLDIANHTHSLVVN